MKKNIWIINEHLTTRDLSENGHSRHYALGLQFIANEYNVSLITSSYSHNPKRKVPIIGLLKILNSNVRTLVLKGFEHKKSSSKIRIINWLLFSILFYLAPLTRLPRPDIIILSSTPMLPIYNVLFFKMIYPKCKFIFETRDLWPLTPLSVGNYSRKSLFIKVLTHLERKCYSKADYIVSVLKNSNKHITEILEKKNFKFKWISNGIDLMGFAGNQKEMQWNFRERLENKDAVIVGYAGTLGKTNAMEHIVESFNVHFKKSKFYLIILGDGAEKENLVKSAGDNPNIIFLDPVNRQYLLSFYNQCDLLYLGWRKVKLYRYGISANKLFEYMYSKKPILMSCDIPGNIIEEANCGIVAEAEDINDMAFKIREFSKLSNLKKRQYGHNGHEYLLNNFTYEKLARDYMDVFLEL